MDYNELAKDALQSAKTIKSISSRLEFYAAAITDLLARAEAAEARAEKAESCINAIEDDLDRGNDNDWAREHIVAWRGQKEE